MSTELTLTIPGRPFTTNEQRRSHWTVVRRAKNAAHVKTYVALDGRRGPSKGLRFPVAVTVQDNCATAHLRDVSACSPTVKGVLDALTALRIWPDDSPEYVASITYLPPVKTGVNELVITIKSAEP